MGNNTIRKKQTTEFWLAVLNEFTKENITPPEIAQKHVNPLTGKPYTQRHIYLILRKMGAI